MLVLCFFFHGWIDVSISQFWVFPDSGLAHFHHINKRGGFAAGPLGLSVEVHVDFDKNFTMLVEKF